METKPCIECGQEKPPAKFYSHPAMADGTVNICKTCHRARMRMERRLYGHRDQASPSMEE